MVSLFNIDIGNLELNIESHWGYYIGGAICIVLFLISLFFTYRSYKYDYYVEQSYGKLYWLKNFWNKNKKLFYICLDVILFILMICFFLVGAGIFDSN